MTEQVPHPMSPQDCLVAIMVAISASDETIRTAELVKIQSAVNLLPIFAEYDTDRITWLAQTVFDLFEQEDGLDALFGLVRAIHKGEKVLLVDDHPKTLVVLAEMVSVLGGRAVPAESVPAAVTTLRQAAAAGRPIGLAVLEDEVR